MGPLSIQVISTQIHILFNCSGDRIFLFSIVHTYYRFYCEITYILLSRLYEITYAIFDFVNSSFYNLASRLLKIKTLQFLGILSNNKIKLLILFYDLRDKRFEFNSKFHQNHGSTNPWSNNIKSGGFTQKNIKRNIWLIVRLTVGWLSKKPRI